MDLKGYFYPKNPEYIKHNLDKEGNKQFDQRQQWYECTYSDPKWDEDRKPYLCFVSAQDPSYVWFTNMADEPVYHFDGNNIELVKFKGEELDDPVLMGTIVKKRAHGNSSKNKKPATDVVPVKKIVSVSVKKKKHDSEDEEEEEEKPAAKKKKQQKAQKEEEEQPKKKKPSQKKKEEEETKKPKKKAKKEKDDEEEEEEEQSKKGKKKSKKGEDDEEEEEKKKTSKKGKKEQPEASKDKKKQKGKKEETAKPKKQRKERNIRKYPELTLEEVNEFLEANRSIDFNHEVKVYFDDNYIRRLKKNWKPLNKHEFSFSVVGLAVLHKDDPEKRKIVATFRLDSRISSNPKYFKKLGIKQGRKSENKIIQSDNPRTMCNYIAKANGKELPKSFNDPWKCCYYKTEDGEPTPLEEWIEERLRNPNIMVSEKPDSNKSPEQKKKKQKVETHESDKEDEDGEGVDQEDEDEDGEYDEDEDDDDEDLEDLIEIKKSNDDDDNDENGEEEEDDDADIGVVDDDGGAEEPMQEDAQE